MDNQTRIQITAETFFERPESNLPVQLLHGEIIEMTAPELDHQDVVGNLFVLLKQAAQRLNGKAYVAPVDVQLSAVDVPQPDVLLLLPGSRCVPLENKRLQGPPDLIAEVLSPSTARLDRRVKFRLYEQHGVREYWMVDPRDQLVEVWQQDEGTFTLLDVYGVDESFDSGLIGTVACRDIFG